MKRRAVINEQREGFTKEEEVKSPVLHLIIEVIDVDRSSTNHFNMYGYMALDEETINRVLRRISIGEKMCEHLENEDDLFVSFADVTEMQCFSISTTWELPQFFDKLEGESGYHVASNIQESTYMIIKEPFEIDRDHKSFARISRMHLKPRDRTFSWKLFESSSFKGGSLYTRAFTEADFNHFKCLLKAKKEKEEKEGGEQECGSA